MESAAAPRPQPFPQHLPRPLLVFTAINAVLGLLAGLSLYIARCRLHIPWPQLNPYFFPLQSGKFQHWDFRIFLSRFRYFHSTAFFATGPQMSGEPPFEYPAPAALLYRFFYAFPHATRSFLLFVLLVTTLLAWLLARQMLRRGLHRGLAYTFAALAALFSYPFWFEFALGNLEFCIFLIIGGGVLAFCLHRPYLAAALFGTAAAMKIFPFVFVALFLPRRQYKPILFAAAVVIALNLIGLWAIDPSILQSYRGINAGLQANRHHYMLTVLRPETSIDHSIFGLLKRLAYERGISILPPWILSAYLAIASIGGILLYFGRIARLPLLNQVLCLYIVAVLLPPTSHDYTLIHLYIPWAMLVLYTLDRVRARDSINGLLPVFVLFAIVFSPENEFIPHHFGISAQIKCLALIALFILALIRRWDTPHWFTRQQPSSTVTA